HLSFLTSCCPFVAWALARVSIPFHISSAQRRLVMISQKKLEANRRNAEKSTGPKTPEGKERSSQNGLTHGLTSKKCPIWPGENEEEYRELQDALTRDLKPRGAMQREMVEDIVQTRWKIRRVPDLEAELMWREQEQIAKDHDYNIVC